MTPPKLDDAIESTIAALSTASDDALSQATWEGIPDRDEVIEWTERAKSLLLAQRERSSLRSEVPVLAERLLRLLRSISLPAGIEAETVGARLLCRLPELRARLAQDVEAAYEGDPAAKSLAEIVVSYPAIRAIATYRIAHELHGLGVPMIPRIMTEYAHDRTGIDIHPGAKIGSRFFIDHGTGVVIGETTEIGDRVRLYQGVTLGALSPRRGESLRGQKRHPTIEDDVTIYAGATILGGRTVIGHGSVVGGNVWLVEPIPPGSKVVAEPPHQLVRLRSSEEEAQALQLHWDI